MAHKERQDDELDDIDPDVTRAQSIAADILPQLQEDAGEHPTEERLEEALARHLTGDVEVDQVLVAWFEQRLRLVLSHS